jgi:predicted PurR-regulated permease PerM
MAGWKIALWIGIVALAAGFLYLVRGVLLPFALALIISVLLDPTIKKLRTRGMSRGAAISLVFVGFFGALTGIGVYLTPIVTNQIGTFRDTLQVYSEQLAAEGARNSVFVRWNPVVRAQQPGATGHVDRILSELRPTLERLGLPTTRRALIEQYVEPRREEIAGVVQSFFNSFLGIVSTIAAQALLLLLTPILVAMMLLDMERMRVRAVTWIPPAIRGDTVQLIREVSDVFIRYLRGVTITVAIYTAMMAILLSLLGAPYSVLLALLFGALYMIPFIGAWISCVTLFVTTGLTGTTGAFFWAVGSPWLYAAIITLIFFVCSELYDRIVYPQLVGRSVGLNMMVSMFVIFAGGALFGLVGMILAYPVAGSVKVVLERLLRVTTSTGVDSLALPVTPLRHRTASEV